MLVEESTLERAALEQPFAVGRRCGGDHVRSLDGLRCLAIAAVFARHSGVPGGSLGWLGVDLFFVLSGFLITTLLLKEYRETGTLHIGKFWARRFVRLMPTYWLCAGLVCALMFVFHWGRLTSNGWWTPRTYVASIFLYFTNYAPGGVWEYENLVMPLWSLSVEEQFYFTWPIVCLALLRLRAIWAAWLITVAILANFLLTHQIYHLDTRGFGIMLGCASALTLGNNPAMLPRLASPVFRVSVVAGTAVVLAVMTALKSFGLVSETQAYQYFMPVACLAFAPMVAMLWYGPNDLIARALSWGPIVYLGKISYGMYLYHMGAHYLTWHLLLPGIEGWSRWPKFGLRMLVFVGVTTGIASLSYYGFERRLLGLKSRLR